VRLRRRQRFPAHALRSGGLLVAVVCASALAILVQTCFIFRSSLTSSASESSCGGSRWLARRTSLVQRCSGAAVVSQDTMSNFSSDASSASDVEVISASPQAEEEFEALLGLLLRGDDALKSLGEVIQEWYTNPELAPNVTSARAALGDMSGAKEMFEEMLSPLLGAGSMPQETVTSKFMSMQNKMLRQEFDELRRGLIDALFRKRIKEGMSLQIQGLVNAQELNGCIGTVKPKRKDEREQFPDDDMTVLQVPGGVGRIAVPTAKLTFPKFSLGESVTMHGGFEKSDAAYEGRAAIISNLTEEDLEAGRTNRGGLICVDVPPEFKFFFEGDEPEERFQLWPELLRPRPLAAGDVVKLVNLESNADLNGARGTVVEPKEKDAERMQDGTIILQLENKKKRLVVKTSNTRLIKAASKGKGFR